MKNIMRAALAILFIFALVTCSIDLSSDEAWKEYIIGDVTVKFPAKPKEQKMNNTKNMVEMFSYESADVAYVVTKTQFKDEDLSKYTREELDNALYNLTIGWMRGLGENPYIVTSDYTQQDGIRYCDSHVRATHDGNDITVYARMFVYGEFIYNITTSMSGAVDAETVWRQGYTFFTSVRIED